MTFTFLWKGPDKVTRNSVINSVKNGGINLMDIATQIKTSRLSWIPRTLDSTRKGPWKSYFNHYLKLYRGTFLLTVRATTRTGYIITSSNFTNGAHTQGRDTQTYLSSFLGLEALFSHSTLGALPLNNKENTEWGKNGVCEGFHAVLYVKPLKQGAFQGKNLPDKAPNIQRKKVRSNFSCLSKNQGEICMKFP